MIVLDEWETLRRVRDSHLSLSRYGDGEAKLARDVGAKTQQADPDLAAALRGILTNPHPRVMVCIPRIFDADPSLNPGYWRQYTRNFIKRCKPDHQWGSSFVSRRDAWPIEDEDAYWHEWRSIWAHRRVLLVTGSGKGMRSKDLLSTAASIEVLDVPRQSAWSAYQGALDDCRAWAACKADPCVVAACGAMATVLCHGLGSEGVQALDVGHMAQSWARVSPKELAA